MLDQIELGRRLGRFDVDFSGGLDSEEFVKLYQNLLQDAVGDAEPQLSRRRSRSRPKVTEQSLELPSDPRYIRALLSSEHLLKQQAFGVFVQLDLDGNGQLDRDELFGLCLALHRKLGVKLPDDVAVGLQLARAVAREHADWPGNSQLSVDFEVQLRSKERLRHMLRTGQKERVKKELAASLPLVVEQDEERRPSMKLDSSSEDGQTKRLKNKVAASEPKKRQGDAAEALRMMTFQRNELLKARRALEQVVDRRRESDKIMDKLKQVLAKYKKPKPAVDSAIADATHEQFHLRERSAIDKA